MLGVQVHAHPGEAFHSGTDDAFPVVTTEGGLSIVAPSFCKDALVANAAIFRLVDQEWVPESPESQLLQAE
jgi:hypothetical protein